MSDREERLEALIILTRELLGASGSIRSANFTRKTKGNTYPIQTGYSTQVRRPMRDVLRWMDLVEEALSLIVDELGDLRSQV